MILYLMFFNIGFALCQRETAQCLSGPELAALMKKGTQVVRTSDWEIYVQDGVPPVKGTVTKELDSSGWLQVTWDAGVHSYHRMEGIKKDLKVAPLSDDSQMFRVSTTEIPNNMEKNTITSFLNASTDKSNSTEINTITSFSNESTEKSNNTELNTITSFSNPYLLHVIVTVVVCLLALIVLAVFLYRRFKKKNIEVLPPSSEKSSDEKAEEFSGNIYDAIPTVPFYEAKEMIAANMKNDLGKPMVEPIPLQARPQGNEESIYENEDDLYTYVV